MAESETEKSSSLPETTDELPLVPYRVLYTDIPFFSDAECKTEVRGARIAILEALDPDDPDQEKDVVPTSKVYEPGQLVTWAFEKESLWEACWYQNPETGQVEQAWNFHVEFTGEVISEATLEKNRETLKEIETRLSELASQRVN